MDKQEYCCLFENFSETAAKRTVLAKTTGKEELQSYIVCIGRILCLCVQAKLNDPRIEEFS